MFPVQMTKMSSRYLFQRSGCLSEVVRNSSSMDAINRFAKVGASFVPMAVPQTCLYIFPANVKILCLAVF